MRRARDVDQVVIDGGAHDLAQVVDRAPVLAVPGKCCRVQPLRPFAFARSRAIITSVACSRPRRSQRGSDSKTSCNRRWQGRHKGDEVGVSLAAQPGVAAVVEVRTAKSPGCPTDLADRVAPVGGGPAPPPAFALF